MYQILVVASARKDLRDIEPRKLLARITNAIGQLEATPRPRNCEKLSGFENTYRIRVGDYRIVYIVHDVVLIVEVIRIAHRREVYKLL